MGFCDGLIIIFLLLNTKIEEWRILHVTFNFKRFLGSSLFVRWLSSIMKMTLITKDVSRFLNLYSFLSFCFLIENWIRFFLLTLARGAMRFWNHWNDFLAAINDCNNATRLNSTEKNNSKISKKKRRWKIIIY